MAGSGRFDQVFNTAPGQTYYVQGWLRINQQTVAPSWGGLRISAVSSSWSQLASTPYQSAATMPIRQWTPLSFSFVATSAQTRLIYQNFGNGQFDADADDFVVSSSPIPGGGLPTSTPTATPTPTPSPTRTPTQTPGSSAWATGLASV
jgi:hypothetical protein